jgi:hypothetical protein
MMILMNLSFKGSSINDKKKYVEFSSNAELKCIFNEKIHKSEKILVILAVTLK